MVCYICDSISLIYNSNNNKSSTISSNSNNNNNISNNDEECYTYLDQAQWFGGTCIFNPFMDVGTSMVHLAARVNITGTLFDLPS